LASLSSGSQLVYDLDSKVNEACAKYAEKRQTGVSLKTLLDTGRGDLLGKARGFLEPEVAQAHTATEQVLIQVAMFLHHELPIRLARRVVDLQRIQLLRDMDSVRLVHRWYAQSFEELLNCPAPNTAEKEEAFANVLQNIYQRHAATLLTMARGAYELRQELGRKGGRARIAFEDHRDIHNFLDSFYMSRIGIRVLIGQVRILLRPSQPAFAAAERCRTVL